LLSNLFLFFTFGAPYLGEFSNSRPFRTPDENSTINLLALNPLFALPVQEIVLGATNFTAFAYAILSAVSRHVEKDFDTHWFLLTKSQVPITGWELLKLGLVQLGNLVGVHWNEFVLLKERELG
jgi:hypothetical protein